MIKLTGTQYGIRIEIGQLYAGYNDFISWKDITGNEFTARIVDAPVPIEKFLDDWTSERGY